MGSIKQINILSETYFSNDMIIEEKNGILNFCFYRSKQSIITKIYRPLE